MNGTKRREHKNTTEGTVPTVDDRNSMSRNIHGSIHTTIQINCCLIQWACVAINRYHMRPYVYTCRVHKCITLIKTLSEDIRNLKSKFKYFKLCTLYTYFRHELYLSVMNKQTCVYTTVLYLHPRNISIYHISDDDVHMFTDVHSFPMVDGR